MAMGIFLGYGPDVDHLLANRDKIPAQAELYRINVLGDRADPAGIPLVNPFSLHRNVARLRSAGIRDIITIGSLRMRISRNMLREGGSVSELIELLPHLTSWSANQDSGRTHIYAKLAEQFNFPRVKDILPWLFAPADVSVNSKDDLRDKALADERSYERDATLQLSEVWVKVFRVRPGLARNLINRRLDPSKLERLHREEEIRHFFFDRDRTTVVDLETMEAYANANGITLQSFTDES